MIGEVRLGGVYIAPILPYAAFALFPFLLARWIALRSGLMARVWHPALFEIGLYIISVAVLFLYC